jgi:hypothetical protein
MGRSIFVGDVHGCARELGELLELVAPVSGDAVYFVGDLVARGPDSRGVLRLYREVKAKGVVGNHEARVLEVRRSRLKGEDGPRLGASHEALLRELEEADWALLDALPLYLDVKLDVTAHDVRVVHAGVLPGVSLRKQDAWTLTHIRSVGEDGRPSAEAGRESWAASYREKPHLVFGHDARRGLQLHAWATGLDTACVYGGSLTALVLPSGETMPFPKDRRELLVSVRARDTYYTSSEFSLG